MTIKDLIYAEIDKLEEETLNELYEIVKHFTHVKAVQPQAGALNKLKRIKIQAPESFAANLDSTTPSVISGQRYNFPKDRKIKTDMSTLEQIEEAILTLSSEEFQSLKDWFFEVDYQRWDEQLEQDITDGKLETLAQEAIADYQAGHCQML